jgi:hypothetical protein
MIWSLQATESHTNSTSKVTMNGTAPSRFPADALNHFISATKIIRAQGQETAKRLERKANYAPPFSSDVVAA